ncbi:MAG: amidohydrolase family protein [bacterium]
MGLVLKNVRIFDGETLSHPSSLFISGGKIMGVGEGFPEFNPRDGWEFLDCQGKVAFPGLIDCHTHLYQTFGRGLMDDLHITNWLEVIWQFPRIFSEEALYYSTLLGAMEALKTGTTLVADLIEGRGEEPILQAIIDSGLKAVMGKMQNDFPEGKNTPVKSTEECLKDSRRFFKKWQGSGNGRINVHFSFAGLPASTEGLVGGMVKLSREYGVGIHAHAAEGKEPTEQVKRRFNSGEIFALEKLGALGPSTLLAHVIWVEEREMDLLAQRGVSVVHCPFTNCKVTDGLSPMYEMSRRGVNITFGCDGAASSSNYDLIREAQLGSMLQKVSSMDEKAFNPSFLFRCMTSNGAKALGLEREVGKIEPGFKADLILLELPPAKNLSWETFFTNLMYSSSGGEAVKGVIIEGKTIIWEGKFLPIPEESVLNIAREIFLKEKWKLEKALAKTFKKE